MKILTAAEMRAVDRATIENGIPEVVLMENAAHRVFEAMEREFGPLSKQRIVVFCGKGNNGGDGLALTRLLHVRGAALTLHAVLAGKAPANLRMLEASGFSEVHSEITEPMLSATLIVDALLGTGLRGPARGAVAEYIHAINTRFPEARVIAVDVPSGMNSDSGESQGEISRADLTVTFTAPKLGHAMPPNCNRIGKLVVAPIGSPAALMVGIKRTWNSPAEFASVLAPRARDGHKGIYGHALIVAGSPGKTGAAAMSGWAALRAGAGLVTVAPPLDRGAPELMTAEFNAALLPGKACVAIGPGLGTGAVTLLETVLRETDAPIVLDADALNILSKQPDLLKMAKKSCVLTPHPGEMARLQGRPVVDRLQDATDFAVAHGCTLVLKGERTIIAHADGTVAINPTGSPAMATAGSGDVLTGLIAGFLSQQQNSQAVLAAVWLHGRAGELAALDLEEQCVTATSLLDYLPQAIRDARA